MPRTAVKPGGSTVRGDRYGNFTEEDAYKTWRVISHNRELTGSTEGFGFSNGQAVVTGLPKTVKHYSADCNENGELCRLHERVFRLNNLMNYPGYMRVMDERSGKRKTERFEGYRILSEEAYEREFGDVNEVEGIDLEDL